METQKNDEKNIVLKLKHQLGRMMVQVDYMYRNDREMSRLDLDILMERTRDLYDLLCDYGAGTNQHLPAGEISDDAPKNTEINEGGELINRDVDFEIENDNTDVDLEEEKPVEEEEPVEEVKKHILDVDESEDVDDEDWEDEEDEVFHIEQPVEEMQETLVEVEDAADETVPEPEDNSLAARLQRTPVTDIRLALGINDKVMIINELFMGSVERYNKSIDALNDFPTLSGARVYMSELQIELQWDTESQAYKMLNDLVERRFV